MISKAGRMCVMDGLAPKNIFTYILTALGFAESFPGP